MVPVLAGVAGVAATAPNIGRVDAGRPAQADTPSVPGVRRGRWR